MMSTSRIRVMKPVAQAVGVAAQMTSVPPSLISSPPKHRRSTRTGGRWRLQPHSLAGHCRHCSSSASVSYCRDSGDNPGSSQRNCVLATETANFLLFLYSWTLGQWTVPQTLAVFYKTAVLQPASHFSFPKEYQVPDWTISCFFQISLKTISTLERILSQSFITGDFLSFISFYAAKGKKNLTVCVFPQWENRQGKKTRKFSFWIKPDSRLLHFNSISTKQRKEKRQERNKKQMQLFFTDSQVSFRNFCRMIQVIRMITVIGRKAGFIFFPQH